MKKEEKVFHLIYGPPGSGKTTFAKTSLKDGKLFEVDDYDGLYNKESGVMNLMNLPNAHKWCQNAFKEAVEKGESPLVHTVIRLSSSPNTKYYLDLAKENGYKLDVHTPLHGLLFYKTTKTTTIEEQIQLLIDIRGKNTTKYVPEDIIRDCCQTLLITMNFGILSDAYLTLNKV